MKLIILKKGEKIEFKDYINMNVKIICEGDNEIKNCYFGNIKNEEDCFIEINGDNNKIINCVFTENVNEMIYVNEGSVCFKENLFFKNKKDIKIRKGEEIRFIKNRIENNDKCFLEVKKVNDFYFYNNEVINCKGYIDLQCNNPKDNTLYNSFIVANKIDSRGIRDSLFIINESNCLMKTNDIKNIDTVIKMEGGEMLIKDNVFSYVKLIENYDKNIKYVDNNFINVKRISNKKENKSYNGFWNKEYDFNLEYMIIEEDKDIETIKIKYLEKENKEEQEQKNINCCCYKLSKMIKINEKLAEYQKMNKEMAKLIKEIKKIMIE